MTAEEAFKLSQKRELEITKEKFKEFQARVDKGLYNKLFSLIKEATEKGHFTVEIHKNIFNHPEIIKNFATDMKRLEYEVQNIKESPSYLLVGWAHHFERSLNDYDRELTPKEDKR